MTHNRLILDKLEVKTKNDKILRKFIEDLIYKETEGGQFAKTYKQLIEKAAKEMVK